MSSTCIVGLGYVGLPLLVNAAAKGVWLNGFDVDKAKIAGLKNGECHIAEYEAAFKKLDTKKHHFFSDASELTKYDEIIICVPTPVDDSFEPDHGYVDSVIDALIMIRHLPSLIVLESTVAPGYTRKSVVHKLENAFGRVCGVDFHVCFSPEREDPGNKKFTNIRIPKVLGGFSARCSDRCLGIYANIFDSIVRASSLETAELTKLHENTFRAVNIAYVNQLRDLAVNLEIDLKEVIELAASKPFGFTRFDPSNGVGGHCIPVDPYFLLSEFSSKNIVEESMKYIRSIPKDTYDWIDETASRQDSFVIFGLGYKDGVDDLRNSPNLQLMELLAEKYQVSYFDPLVSSDSVNGCPAVTIDQVVSGDATVIISSSSGEDLVKLHDINEYIDVRYRKRVG